MRKGTHHKSESLLKMSKSHTGVQLSPEHRLKCGKHWIGKKHTEETKQKMSKSATAENNSQWKGDGVGYCSLHEWIRNRKPQPVRCQHCGKISKRLDLANISGWYCRDVNDYEYLCRSCHQIYDCKMGFRTTVCGKVIKENHE